MRDLALDQQTMLATWQQHTYAEFVLKDVDAALATMTEIPYVFMISCGLVRVGRVAVREFYAEHFLPQIPPDLEITSLSQTFGDDRLVEEMVMRFTHSIEMEWILPGLRPTGRTAEFVLAGVIQFEGGRVAHEHLYWDQATLLSQMGVLDHPLTDSAPQLLRLADPGLRMSA